MTIGAGKIEIEKRPHMVVNRDYVFILESCGLLDFDRLYHYQGGIAVKQIRDRSVLRLDVHDGTKNKVFYLKRHSAVRCGFQELITNRMTGHSPSPGMSEFENICDFRTRRIPTVTPVAAGERRVGFARYESFLLTESYDPYISLEEIIYHHPEMLQGADGRLHKEKLIESIAKLARQMHDAGFNHRDFNATHVLVGPEGNDGNLPLALFDLQRMDRKKWLRWKWFIKIMAELSYTMPEPLFNDQDRLLLYQSYKGSFTLQMLDRALLKLIKMKMKKISRHTDKIRVRRNKENHLNRAL
ncbi:MAG: hypothetical protein JW902_02925 [Syntrophaceae bacterium]|nr:hypothetical protein [Syntrophaceae bacterium]